RINDETVSWDHFVLSHPQGTPFHLRAWQNTIESTFGHQPLHLIARQSDPEAVVGVLPLFLVRSLIFGRMLISTPQAAYGGILASSPEAEDALLEQAKDLANENNVNFLELR